MTYIVATVPGGGYDTYGRLISKYFEKHLQLYKVLVKNMSVAGHIIGATKRDSSTASGYPSRP